MRPTWAVLAFAAGCTPALPPPEPISQQPLSSYSSSESYSGSGKGLSVPSRARITDEAVLCVRPDLFTFGFALREMGATPAQAVNAVKARAEAVERELKGVIGPGTTFNSRGLALAEEVREAEVLGYTASVDGLIEVRLEETQDFWARARLYAIIVQATRAVTTAARNDETTRRAASFEAPRAVVTRPEAHRAELLKRWITRVKEFAAVAEAERAPLFVRDCAPPAAIQQSQVSFDEVSLTLGVSCRVDTAEAHRSRNPNANGEI
jgi:hypothetical protein